MNALKLHTNGLAQVIDIHEERYEYTFQAMQRAIDCEMVDIVHGVNLPDPYCLVVDDEFLLKGTPVINLVASYLYGANSHGQPLCGDILIMKDKHTPDGLETTGLTEDDVLYLCEWINDAIETGDIRDTAVKLSETLRFIKEEE